MTPDRTRNEAAPAAVSLPCESFNEIAARLLEYANRTARAVEEGQIIAARGQAGLGVTIWLRELESSAVTAGQIYQMFRDLAPYEAELRAFVASLEGKV